VSIYELRLEAEDQDELFGSVLEAAGAPALQLIQLTRKYLPRFGQVSRTQSFIDLCVLNLARKLQWRISLIVLNSCQQLDAIFPQSSNSLRHISAISYVPIH
jgi:hypothetical protein